MPMPSIAPSPLLSGLIDIALLAGDKVLEIYQTDFEARIKDDQSPVTEADLAAEAIILEGLEALEPGANVISEEATAAGEQPFESARFFLVDPLDGTKEFLNRNGEFTINIGLIENRRPIAGVVYAPAIERLFWGSMETGSAEAAPGHGKWRRISVRGMPEMGKSAVASRSHRDKKTDAWLKAHNIENIVSAGSSLKFCLIAAGEADVYPRFGRTMEWDTAAGHAVLRAAGGEVYDEDGDILNYGKKARGFDNPSFIASSTPLG